MARHVDTSEPSWFAERKHWRPDAHDRRQNQEKLVWNLLGLRFNERTWSIIEIAMRDVFRDDTDRAAIFRAAHGLDPRSPPKTASDIASDFNMTAISSVVNNLAGSLDRLAHYLAPFHAQGPARQILQGRRLFSLHPDDNPNETTFPQAVLEWISLEYSTLNQTQQLTYPIRLNQIPKQTQESTVVGLLIEILGPDYEWPNEQAAYVDLMFLSYAMRLDSNAAGLFLEQKNVIQLRWGARVKRSSKEIAKIRGSSGANETTIEKHALDRLRHLFAGYHQIWDILKSEAR